MKKLLLLTGVLLAFCATSASATGVDLNWNNCLFNAAARTGNGDMVPFCDPADPATSNGNIFQMFGSVRTGVNIPGVIAWGADIDVQTASATLDPWWQMGAGECRDGSITFIFNGFANVTSCNKNLMVTSPAPLPVALWQSFFQGNPNRAHYGIGVARTTGVTAVGTTKYQLFQANIDSRFSVADPNAPGDPVCQGCLDPACLVLNHVEVDVPATQASDGKNHYYNPEIFNYVTWNGGGVGGNGCPAATPTKKATWGQVKSLYR